MSHQFEKSASVPFGTLQRVEGTVQHLDTVGREIVVLLATRLVVFDVACECAILLRGEPIKLRVIQPGDRVRVTFVDGQGSKIAQMLEVPPNSSFAAPRIHAATFAVSRCSSSAAAGGQTLSSDARTLAAHLAMIDHARGLPNCLGSIAMHSR